MDGDAQDLSKIPEHKRILFVTPTGKFDKESAPSTVEKDCGSMTGEEARSFYEEILAGPSSPIGAEVVKPRKRKNPPVPIESLMCTEQFTIRDINRFLKSAADGDLKAVTQFFERGMSLDVVDSFGWSALHCAAAAGHATTCLFLVQNGANWSILDTTGASFADLARRGNHTRVLQAVTEFFCGFDDDEIEDEIRGYCKDCDREYTGTEADHLTNLSHLVRINKKNPVNNGFFIPPWNPGFKLLKKAGWSGEDGLGKDKQGKKYPVRTILKRNRAGFGTTKEEARVTHFGPHDERAVQSERVQTVKEETKKERERRIRKEKKIEMDFRWTFKDPTG